MKRKKLNLFDKIIIFIAICLAIGLICGILAGESDPRTNIFLAFAGLAYPYFLLANVIILFYWIVCKRWVFTLVTILIICSGWHSLISTYGLFGNSGKNEKTEEKVLRMMTYNVHDFKPFGDELNEKVKEKMLAIIKVENPDVICFQEFYTKYKGKFNTIDSLKKILNTQHHYFLPTMKSESEAIGLAIFSKYPINNSGNIAFEGSNGNGSIYVDLEVNKHQLRIYNVHLQSISFEKEDYRYLDKVKEMDTEMASPKRIARMLMRAFKKRSVQVDLMKTHMKTCTTSYVVAGDFNDTPASYVVTKMTDSLNNAFVKKGQGLGKTYNGKFPNFQIDYILTTKDIEVTNYKIIEAKLSDHFPVRSDLRLKAKL